MEEKITFNFAYKNFNKLTVSDFLDCAILSKDGVNLQYTAKIMKNNTDFVGISLAGRVNEEAETEDGKFFKQYNLKFHISLPEKDKDTEENSQYNRGWEIICKTLMTHRIVFFKVIKPGLKMSDVPEQRGKDVTIYVTNNPDKSCKDWQAIFEEITRELVMQGISPGYKQVTLNLKRERGSKIKGSHREEKHIKGSHYVSYRYEGEETDEKILRNWCKTINYPDNDPCEDLSIEVDSQVENPVWEGENPYYTPK